MNFETLGNDRCRIGFYVNGEYISSYIPWSDDKEAAKDYIFMVQGYEVSPIDDVELSAEEMKDPSKTRRFKYYAEYDLADIASKCSIVNGELYFEGKPFYNSGWTIENMDEYLLKYYLDDIKANKERVNKV